MASDSSERSFGGIVYGIFWLGNFIYTIVYWGGWAILWNFFIPYAFLYDLVVKYGPMIHGGK